MWTARGPSTPAPHPPVKLLAMRAYPDRATASKAEWQLKRQPRARKLAWLQAVESA